MLAWESEFHRPAKPFRHGSRLRRVLEKIWEYTVLSAATGALMWLLIELGTRHWAH